MIRKKNKNLETELIRDLDERNLRDQIAWLIYLIFKLFFIMSQDSGFYTIEYFEDVKLIENKFFIFIKWSGYPSD